MLTYPLVRFAEGSPLKAHPCPINPLQSSTRTPTLPGPIRSFSFRGTKLVPARYILFIINPRSTLLDPKLPTLPLVPLRSAERVLVLDREAIPSPNTYFAFGEEPAPRSLRGARRAGGVGVHSFLLSFRGNESCPRLCPRVKRISYPPGQRIFNLPPSRFFLLPNSSLLVTRFSFLPS